MKKFLSSVGSWIWVLIFIPFLCIVFVQVFISFVAAVIVCILAFPISMVGYALNVGISVHLQINKAIKQAKL